MPTPRPATPDDLGPIETCARQAYAPYVERIGREPAPMVADFSSLIAAARIHVMEDEQDRFCGYVVFYPVGDDMMLENVAVSPDRQGHGHGRTLIDFVESEARRAGLQTVTLYTNVHMHENVEFYPALGYVETGRRREDGFDRVYFAKRLDGGPR